MKNKKHFFFENLIKFITNVARRIFDKGFSFFYILAFFWTTVGGGSNQTGMYISRGKNQKVSFLKRTVYKPFLKC